MKWPKKDTKYCFTVFGLMFSDSQKDYYKCVCKIVSPPFTLVSSRNQPQKHIESENINSMQILTISKPLSTKYTIHNSLILSPLLIKCFPFITKGVKSIMYKINQKIPSYLSKLTNYESNPNIIVKYGEVNREIRKCPESYNCTCQECIIQFLNSTPEESYTEYDAVGLTLRYVGDINISAKRQELSFQGDSIPSFLSRYHNSMYYLDRYGNKCKMNNLCFMDTLQKLQLIS